jgi:hypothetical protein
MRDLDLLARIGATSKKASNTLSGPDQVLVRFAEHRDKPYEPIGNAKFTKHLSGLILESFLVRLVGPKLFRTR